jgi:hypothetical protein
VNDGASSVISGSRPATSLSSYSPFVYHSTINYYTQMDSSQSPRTEREYCERGTQELRLQALSDLLDDALAKEENWPFDQRWDVLVLKSYFPS